MKKLRLIRSNSFDTITAPTLEELNHEKNKIELENNKLYDVCCFGNDDTLLGYLRQKQLKSEMMMNNGMMLEF